MNLSVCLCPSACWDTAALEERPGWGGATGAKQTWDDQDWSLSVGGRGHTTPVTHALNRTGPARDREFPQREGSPRGYFGCGDINQTPDGARETLGSGQSLERVAWVGCGARFYKRLASGQLEPGGGDEMPFASHHKPLICGQKNTTSLWAAWATVAPRLLLAAQGLAVQFSSLQDPSPGIPTPGSLFSYFVLTQSLGHLALPSVWEKWLDSGTSRPLGLEVPVPTRNIWGSRQALVRGALHSKVSFETHACLSACMDAEAGHLL